MQTPATTTTFASVLTQVCAGELTSAEAVRKLPDLDPLLVMQLAFAESSAAGALERATGATYGSCGASTVSSGPNSMVSLRCGSAAETALAEFSIARRELAPLAIQAAENRPEGLLAAHGDEWSTCFTPDKISGVPGEVIGRVVSVRSRKLKLLETVTKDLKPYADANGLDVEVHPDTSDYRIYVRVRPREDVPRSSFQLSGERDAQPNLMYRLWLRPKTLERKTLEQIEVDTTTQPLRDLLKRHAKYAKDPRIKLSPGTHQSHDTLWLTKDGLRIGYKFLEDVPTERLTNLGQGLGNVLDYIAHRLEQLGDDQGLRPDLVKEF